MTDQGETCAVISGLCHLYSNSIYLLKDSNNLYAWVKWFYSLHKDSLLPPTIWEWTEYFLPILKGIPLVIGFLPVLLILIDKLVCFKIQQLLSNDDHARNTVTGSHWKFSSSWNRFMLGEAGGDFQKQDRQGLCHEQQEADTEDMMGLRPSASLRWRGSLGGNEVDKVRETDQVHELEATPPPIINQMTSPQDAPSLTWDLSLHPFPKLTKAQWRGMAFSLSLHLTDSGQAEQGVKFPFTFPGPLSLSEALTCLCILTL